MIKLLNMTKRIKIFLKNAIDLLRELSKDKSKPDVTGDNKVENYDSILELSDFSNEQIDIQPVKEFFEGCIGLIAMDFDSYAKNIEDVGAHTRMRMLTSVSVEGSALSLCFENIQNFNDKVTVVVAPTIGGQFIERQEPTEPDDLCLYRITFFGGHVVDYMNESFSGEIYVR